MLKGLERVDSSKFFQLTDSNSRRRGHPLSLKIYKKSSLKKNLGCRKHFFSQRVVNSWNALPEAVVNAKTVSAFKRQLDSHWKDDMIRYGVTKAMLCEEHPGSICQYKEDGLVSRPPSLFTSMRRPMHGTSCPKSQLKSTCLTAKFGSFFMFLDHAETGEKGQNVTSSSVQHPISLIFAINVSLIILLPMMWILLTKPICLWSYVTNWS